MFDCFENLLIQIKRHSLLIVVRLCSAFFKSKEWKVSIHCRSKNCNGKCSLKTYDWNLWLKVGEKSKKRLMQRLNPRKRERKHKKEMSERNLMTDLNSSWRNNKSKQIQQTQSNNKEVFTFKGIFFKTRVADIWKLASAYEVGSRKRWSFCFHELWSRRMIKIPIWLNGCTKTLLEEI